MRQNDIESRRIEVYTKLMEDKKGKKKKAKGGGTKNNKTGTKKKGKK